jgi:uncharacterized protein (TIGR00251 family)
MEKTDIDQDWLVLTDTGFNLKLYIQPGAKTTQVSGLHDGALKIRLAAPPVEGKANTALMAFLAKRFNCAKREIALLSGDLSRHKVVKVDKPLTKEEIITLFNDI